MGSSASKTASSNGAKSAARHFPSVANIAAQERAAAAAANAARAARESSAAQSQFQSNGGGVNNSAAEEFEAKKEQRRREREGLSSSPKMDYLAEQRKLEEQIAQYDRAIDKQQKKQSRTQQFDGESRPYEDTPSAAEMQFFGNLKTVGQVEVHNPDQIKHHEAEEVLKRKLPSKFTSTTSGTPSQSKSTTTPPPQQQDLSQGRGGQTPWTSATTESAAASAGATLSSLKLMQLLQTRNQDPSVYTIDRLAREFDMRKQDIEAVTRYINTYTIVPGKDAKGRETGVWCEDLRGVEVVDRSKEAEEAAAAKKASEHQEQQGHIQEHSQDEQAKLNKQRGGSKHI
ncbi:hypothetical protein BG004_003833 [Podila humilis]|nr:hypothetical protein BG004_003833 [Podila humilis]